LVETVRGGRADAGTLGVAEPTGGELARGPASPDNAGTMAKAVTSPQTGELSGNQADRAPDPLASRAAGDNASHPALTPQQQLRMMQRVARAVEAAAPGGGVIRLRLHPAELGALQLEVSVNRGVLHARLKTETETARQVLLEQLPYLRDRLEQQGVRMEQFQVDVDRPDTPNYGGQEDPRDLAQQTPRKVPASRTREESSEPGTERHGTDQHGRPVRSVMGRIDVMI